MKLTVNLSKDANTNLAISHLLNDIVSEYLQLIPDGPFLGIKPILVVLLPAPKAIINLLPHVYMIGLTRDTTAYSQLTYQFAHEMGHVYSDPRNNNWLIEAFCEALSLIMLEKMGIKWEVQPSVKGLNYYAAEFDRYKNQVISEYTVDLGINEDELANIQLSGYLRTLESNINRPINFVLSYRILGYYRREPNILKLIPYLHYTSNLVEFVYNDTIFPDLIRFESHLPVDLKVLWEDFKTNLN